MRLPRFLQTGFAGRVTGIDACNLFSPVDGAEAEVVADDVTDSNVGGLLLPPPQRRRAHGAGWQDT